MAPQEDATFWRSLTRRIERGDRNAEAELARHFHRRVRLMASIRLHDSDAALDIAQDTIVAVLEALRVGRLREADKLPAFVLGIARNLINSHRRSEAKSRELLVGPAEGSVEAEADVAALEDQRHALVRQSLRCLKWLDQRILLLTLVQGMTPREIAPIVGLKSEVVRTRKSRAVRAVTAEVTRLTRMRPPDHLDKSAPTR